MTRLDADLGIATLGGLLASRGVGIRRSAIASRFRTALELSRLLVPAAAPLDNTVCLECEEPHVAAIRRTAGGAEMLCLRHGWIALDPSEIAGVSLDIDALARAIAAALAAKGRVLRLGETDAWALGRRRTGGVAASIFLTPHADTPEHIAATLHAIADQPRSATALVIVGALAQGTNALAPEDVRFVGLDDLVALSNDGQLVVDALALDDALAIKPEPRGTPGPREKHSAEIGEAIAQLWPVGADRPTSTAVIARFRKLHPSLPAPSQPTVNRRLREEAKRRANCS